MGPPAAWPTHLDAGGMPDPLHSDWQDLIFAVRRAMALIRQDCGDLNVRLACASEVEHSGAHFHPSRELGDGVDLHSHLKVGHGTTAPDYPDEGNVVVATIEHNLFNETPQ